MSSPPPRERNAEARIYAAASLTDVIAELAKRFEPVRGSHVVASYGASNTLAQQIHEGAAPGVFISASVEWVEKLDSWGLVEPWTRVEPAGNSLVVIVPKDAKDRPASLGDLDNPTYAATSSKVDVAFRVPSERHAFLQTPDAWAVFEKAGFTKP